MNHASNQLNFSSESFLSDLRKRDSGAITRLVEAYTEQLFRASLGLGFDKSAAHEVVQSVWVTFFDVVQGFEGRSHIRTFIFSILYNKASELRRDHKRFESPDPVDEALEKRFDQRGHWIKPPINAEDFMIGSQTVALIEKCLEALPLSQRMAFTMKEVEEEETSDICKILDISVTNLGVLLYRARNRLRECVENKIIKPGV